MRRGKAGRSRYDCTFPRTSTDMPARRYLRIHPKDNVLVALQNLSRGEAAEDAGDKVVLAEDVPQKHKFTLKDEPAGADIRMYGVLVGRLTRALPAGSMISTANLKHAADPFTGKIAGGFHWTAPDVSRFKGRTFQGYHRPDGQVGTQNFWLVLPLVFCENRNILRLKDAFQKELGYAQPDQYRAPVQSLLQAFRAGGVEAAKAWQPPAAQQVTMPRPFANVDGIKFIVHDGGCGGTRQDSNALLALLAGYCVNPNVAGVTVLSLGCQHAQFDLLKDAIARKDPSFAKPMLFFEQQKYGTEGAMMAAAIRDTFVGLAEINKQRRAPAPLSKLTVGVKCGGSDGFSGISANPAVGHCADLLVALGGKVVIAEFPELVGVEQELINRCTSQATADRFTAMMRQYESEAKACGSSMDMNPSPGNIRDGLITDAIKSAGAAKKAGTSPIVDVLDYGEYATKPGLSMLCTPGNDVLATTGKAGAGCQITLFTTGLGTPTGNPVSEMVKVASNTALARRMPDIIDFDCGQVISGEKTVEQVGEDLLEYCIRLASGEFVTKAMELGQDDFIFWQRGVNL